MSVPRAPQQATDMPQVQTRAPFGSALLAWLLVGLSPIPALEAIVLFNRSAGNQNGGRSGMLFSGICVVGFALMLAGVLFLFKRAKRHHQFKGVVILTGVFTLLYFGAFFLALGIWANRTAPPWPNHELRAYRWNITPVECHDYESFRQSGGWNSWSLRDLERTIQKDPKNRRLVFIGDSFLEGGFCPFPLPLLIEQQLKERSGWENTECVNLGISATGLPQYYYRMQTVGFEMNPDGIIVVVYAGNDFVNPGEGYDPQRDTPLSSWIAERPLPSLIGALSPRLDWALVDALKFSEFGKNNTNSDTELLNRLSAMPVDQALPELIDHAQKQYYPQADPSRIKEILSRWTETRWNVFAKSEKDQEYLQAWVISNLLNWELRDDSLPSSVDDVSHEQSMTYAKATMTWIEKIDEACKSRGVPLLIVLAPVGLGDPEYCEFWKPWPNYFSFNYYCQDRYNALVQCLTQKGIPFRDLSVPLEGAAGSYRKTDGHWTEKGHEIVTRDLLKAIPEAFRFKP